jgi:hypothetical protein
MAVLMETFSLFCGHGWQSSGNELILAIDFLDFSVSEVLSGGCSLIELFSLIFSSLVER